MLSYANYTINDYYRMQERYYIDENLTKKERNKEKKMYSI